MMPAREKTVLTKRRAGRRRSITQGAIVVALALLCLFSCTDRRPGDREVRTSHSGQGGTPD